LRLNTGKISETMPKNGSATMYTSGCPKNQNRCCHRIAPPVSASKTWAPSWRSAMTARSAAKRIGNTRMTSRLVMRMFHVKIGIRNMSMPGARIVTIVVIMLTAPRIVPIPEMDRPTNHRSAPMPGELTAFDSGWYANQPKEAAPPGVMNPETARTEPSRYSQYANALRRGNATSGAPICRGTR
jgi:hypothetical protein